ncbi:c-type cytochrome [Candidatus Parabeggiatoa sp. HSG14]|uniref:c-type cytochrome n=1 Tax=Candidatus Parabeggiatoa sp. HSG14 TaxID=3055593 RepID=UPI0025A6E80E|nr:c-type cytochrome [Thiotrichales bacterium HSG14]
MKTVFLFNVVCAMLGLAFTAHAVGNVAAGKVKAAQCIACHGIDGNSEMPQYPKLAGQHEYYLVQSMKAYIAEKRHDPIMSPMAKELKEADNDINDLAAYFASQPANTCTNKPITVTNKTSKAKICFECHKADGNSEKPFFPKIAGQHEAYLIKSMKAYKEGTRLDKQMSQIALLFEDENDIVDLATYFSSQKSDTCKEK